MEPTLDDQTVLFIDKITPKLRNIREGEVVIFKSLHNKNDYICKRATHIGKKTIKVGNKDVNLESGFYWLEGDNKEKSFDSRQYGPVSGYLLVGIARCSIWPRFKFI